MQSLEFVYDDGNQPFAMIYKHGQTTELYYYVLNAQGDVIALLNANGALVASYNYGAWGNYSVHDKDGKKNTSTSFIGHINPLRYRGYYYDRETRLTTSRAGTMTLPTAGSSMRMHMLRRMQGAF